MNHRMKTTAIKTLMVRTVLCIIAAAIVVLASTAPSHAVVWQLPFDATGGSEPVSLISGALAGPQTLDFTVNLNAVYTSDPASSVSGDIQFGVFNTMSNPLIYAQTGGTAYLNDAGNVTTPLSTQPWLNTMVFAVVVNPADLPILVVSLVDSLGGLVTVGGATIKATLTVDLPAGLTASPGVTGTPLPAALPLFATGLGMMGWIARRRRARCGEAFAYDEGSDMLSLENPA